MSSVLAHEYIEFRDIVDVGDKVDVRKLVWRTPALAKPGSIMLYDNNFPPPNGYLKDLIKKGLGADQYIGVRCKSGNLLEDALEDEALIRKLQTENDLVGGGLVLEPFKSSPAAHKLADAVGIQCFGSNSNKLLSMLDNKAEVRDDFFRKLDLPVTEGMFCTGPGMIYQAAEYYLRRGLRVLIKSNLVSAASTGFKRLESLDDLKANKSYIESLDGLSVMVEVYYAKRGSPSIIGKVNKDGSYEFDLTDQILSLSDRYEGTIYESLQSNKIKRRLKSDGETLFGGLSDRHYVGYVGFDFILRDDGKLIPVECNARCTAAMFAQAVHLRKKHDGVTFSGLFHVPKGMTFEVAQSYADEVFTKEGEMILLHNVLCFPYGEGSAIVQAETIERVRSLIGTLTSKLWMSCHKELVAMN